MSAPSKFLSAEDLEGLTGLKRPSAQARWLAARKYKFERRADRNHTIALRQDELDAHTLTRSAQPPRKRVLDLSYLDRAG